MSQKTQLKIHLKIQNHQKLTKTAAHGLHSKKHQMMQNMAKFEIFREFLLKFVSFSHFLQNLT